MSRTELTGRHQEVHVIAAHEILRHIDNRGGHAVFTVVVLGHGCDTTGELGHLKQNKKLGHTRFCFLSILYLDFSVLALDGSEKHLALRGLETIHDRRNGTHIICHTKQHELLVDKVGDLDAVHVMINVGISL